MSENSKISFFKNFIVSSGKQKKNLQKKLKKSKNFRFNKMEIILLENIMNLGSIGDKVTVNRATEEILFLKFGKFKI